jgi:hypothetical protein
MHSFLHWILLPPMAQQWHVPCQGSSLATHQTIRSAMLTLLHVTRTSVGLSHSQEAFVF